MISSVKIEGYRGLERFEMSNLGRVNLLVGTNNCGKTSVLEALYLLAARGEPSSLWQLLFRRGERSFLDATPGARSVELEFEVGHLFTGHEIQLGTKFTITAQNDTPARSLTFAIGKAPRTSRDEPETATTDRLALHVSGDPTPAVAAIPLSRSGGLRTDSLDLTRRSGRTRATTSQAPSQFITTDSLDGDDLVLLWNKVALTPNEGLVLQALRFLAPDIDRIAAQASPGGPYWLGRSRGGFIVKLSNREQPIPIGSMGDGMWRMLAMAIALTHCRGGVLLVDEIDTGLHYSVMGDMWRLVCSAASELDVQVFATTHSYDCVESLARARGHNPSTTVTLQRIEAGRSPAIPYSEAELTVAAERGLEVR
jgi:hypothetical protein